MFVVEHAMIAADEVALAKMFGFGVVLGHFILVSVILDGSDVTGHEVTWVQLLLL